MDRLQAFDTPLEVRTVDGEIAIIGPDGVGISLTREAAIISARRLLEAAHVDEAAVTYQKPLG